MSEPLSVAEFAAQPEVDKHPSQIYGYLKRGLPFVEVNGRKAIPFDEGLAWLQKRQSLSPAKRRQSYGPTIREGDFLTWDRGNNLGPAYGIVNAILDSRLVSVTVEYRTRPVYLEKVQLKRDLASGTVRVAHRTSVEAFLLQELSRVEFLVGITQGADKARAVKRQLLEMELTTADLAERFHETGLKRWPTIKEEVTNDDDN